MKTHVITDEKGNFVATILGTPGPFGDAPTLAPSPCRARRAATGNRGHEEHGGTAQAPQASCALAEPPGPAPRRPYRE